MRTLYFRPVVSSSSFLLSFYLAYSQPSHIGCLPIYNKSSAVAEMGDRLATIDMGRKWCCAAFRGGKLGPHLTQCRLARPSSVPSAILIHPTVWPQYTIPMLQTDGTGQRSRSIGRTVTCNGRPKTVIYVYLGHTEENKLRVCLMNVKIMINMDVAT